MAKLAQAPETTKLFSVVLYLDPPARANHPQPLPSVRVTGVAYKHNHLTYTGTRYTYNILHLQAQGVPNGRNFLNELQAPLLAHMDYLFHPVPQPPQPDYPEYPEGGRYHPRGPEYADYLRSEDYQYDRGEELRARETDPTEWHS